MGVVEAESSSLITQSTDDRNEHRLLMAQSIKTEAVVCALFSDLVKNNGEKLVLVLPLIIFCFIIYSKGMIFCI